MCAADVNVETHLDYISLPEAQLVLCCGGEVIFPCRLHDGDNSETRTRKHWILHLSTVKNSSNHMQVKHSWTHTKAQPHERDRSHTHIIVLPSTDPRDAPNPSWAPRTISVSLSSFAQSLTQLKTSTFSLDARHHNTASDRKLAQPMAYKQPKSRPANTKRSDNILARFPQSYEGYSTLISTFGTGRYLKMYLLFPHLKTDRIFCLYEYA